LILFVLTGLMSALSGIYYALYYNSARGETPPGWKLQVIAGRRPRRRLGLGRTRVPCTVSSRASC